MIAAWMIYSAGVTLLLFAGATAMEYLARALRIPTRLVWAAAIVSAVGLSARALVAGWETRHQPTSSASTPAPMHFGTLSAMGTAGGVESSAPAEPGRLESLLITMRGIAGVIERSAGRIDVQPLERWNAMLIALWAVTSCLTLSWLAGSLWRLRRIERGLAPAMVDDHAVLLSKNVGPALFGIVRSRIVLPDWVLSLPKPERAVILAHERQHAAAFDPALMFAVAFVLALQPWNVALWALFARLRLALEGDCDARVLGSAAAGDPRRYGMLLVAVYERTTPGLTPYLAFVERQGNLERRIRRMMRRPRLISTAAAASALAAAVLVATACAVAAPMRHAMSAVPVAASREMVPIAAAPTPPTVTAVAAPPAQAARCDLFGQAARDGGPRSPQGFMHTGCSIYGDIVVVATDSAHVIVAARDTSDAGIRITAFFVFATTPGTVPPHLTWSTTVGRAQLTDSAFFFSNPAAGTKSLVFWMPGKGAGQRNPDALQFDITNMELLQMRGVSWEVLAQLPVAPRCPAVDPASKPLYVVDGVVQNAPSPETEKVCFLVNGHRVEIPLS